ncbi:MAG: DUF3426 domain-containing protein [Alphaproteobacteria bacterium]|nr:DUF3426 domain-containing protein [Alphaproteobacteria bacterium]
MILECPHCSNRYLVDKRAIGAEGRTVRCAKCKHQWHAMPDATDVEKTPIVLGEDGVDMARAQGGSEPEIPLEEPNPEVRPIPAGSSVPAIPQVKEKFPWRIVAALAASLVLFLMVSAVYFRPLIVASLPASVPVYNALGMYDTTGVVMADVAYFKETPGLKDLHKLNGFLVNTTDEPRQLPMLSVTLLGKEDVVLRRRRLSEPYVLKPRESKEFTQAVEASPDSVKRIVLEFGNQIELKLR